MAGHVTGLVTGGCGLDVMQVYVRTAGLHGGCYQPHSGEGSRIQDPTQEGHGAIHTSRVHSEGKIVTERVN